MKRSCKKILWKIQSFKAIKCYKNSIDFGDSKKCCITRNSCQDDDVKFSLSEALKYSAIQQFSEHQNECWRKENPYKGISWSNQSSIINEIFHKYNRCKRIQMNISFWE
jgi:hypothetical protein